MENGGIDKFKHKFNIGDKVYQTLGHNRLDEYTIKKVYIDKKRGIVYDIQGLIGIMGVEENKLCLSCQNPYTEPSNVSTDETMNETKETMEEKELNLCELLNLGNTIYNPTFGYGRVDLVNTDIKPYFFVSFEDAVISLSFLHNGIEATSNSRPSIWPNEELYEKYPLDAYSAWMEWKEPRKPKRWRAEQRESYWHIVFNKDFDNYILDSVDVRDSIDNACYEVGNYFRTEEEALQAAEVVIETLQKFHEKNIDK